jgi:large subunit ribosomal protein L25
MEIAKLVVHKRDQAGKGVARRLRRAGQLPAVLYGNGPTLAIALAEKDLVHIRQSEAGENTILDLTIAGDTPEACQAILREVQIDPVSRALLHADFYRVDMDKTITVTVPLTFMNEPHNLLLSANAVLTHLWREVEVTCLPRDIPDEIVVDLADIHPGATLKAGELVLPPGVTLVIDPEEVIVTAHVEVEPEEAPAESTAEAEEAEEAP